jgi:preprotein translocase subunit SecG
MIAVLTGFHILICFGLIVVVLLQTGKGTGMASVFGGGGGGALMGGKGFGGVLAKATAVLAVLFMLTSITLSLLPSSGGGQPESLLGNRGIQQPAGTEQPLPGEVPTEPAGQPAEAPAGPPSGQ